jgi:hypothetical protein
MIFELRIPAGIHSGSHIFFLTSYIPHHTELKSSAHTTEPDYCSADKLGQHWVDEIVP